MIQKKAGERMKVRTGIKWVAAIMLMVVLCFSVTVAVKGYGMYREAVDSMSLEDKVASIRAKGKLYHPLTSFLRFMWMRCCPWRTTGSITIRELT